MDVSAIQSWYARTPYTKLVRQYTLYKVGTPVLPIQSWYASAPYTKLVRTMYGSMGS